MLSVPLLSNKKEFFVLLGVVLCIALFSLLFEFYRYTRLTQEPLHVSKATVLNHYEKTNIQGRSYDVLKLKLDDSGAQMYTTSWRQINVSFQDRVKIKFKTDKLTFIDFLKGFYAPSLSLYPIYEDHPPFNGKKLYAWIDEQHESEVVAEVYKTLFFATPLSKELRDDVQKWGISHLVAISGFHLGVLSFILFTLLNPLYRFFQNRYFPYRNAMADVGIIVFILLYGYMELIQFTPSFMRSFVMSVIGFFLFSRGIKILSFGTLGLSAMFLLAFIPSLLFSLSFWFSVAGVFYLFLFLHHFSHLNRFMLLAVMDLGIFFLMVPIVHTFFPVFTFLQLTSPFSSLVFIVFYPLALFLHVIHCGGILDGYLLAFLHVKTLSYTLNFPVWFLGGYIGLSLLAIRFRFGVFLCLGISFLSLFFIQ